MTAKTSIFDNLGNPFAVVSATPGGNFAFYPENSSFSACPSTAQWVAWSSSAIAVSRSPCSPGFRDESACAGRLEGDGRRIDPSPEQSLRAPKQAASRPSRICNARVVVTDSSWVNENGICPTPTTVRHRRPAIARQASSSAARGAIVSPLLVKCPDTADPLSVAVY
jgi:hypothetical protein